MEAPFPPGWTAEGVVEPGVDGQPDTYRALLDGVANRDDDWHRLHAESDSPDRPAFQQRPDSRSVELRLIDPITVIVDRARSPRVGPQVLAP